MRKGKSGGTAGRLAALLLAACLLTAVGGRPEKAVAITQRAPEHYYMAGSWNYYNQLSGFQKKIYEKLNNLDVMTAGANNQVALFTEIKEGADGFNSKTYDADVMAAFDALCKDYPEYFWPFSVGMGLSTRTMNGVPVDYTVKFYVGAYTSDYMNDTRAKYNELKSLVKNISRSGSSDYDKLKSAHDWLCNNLDYVDGFTSHDAYGSLKTKKAVCEGYAKAFKLVCDDFGIPCVLVVGTGINSQGKSEEHMWNYVRMENNKWYAVDVTWDDQTEKASKKIFYEYFLVGSDTASSAGFGGRTFAQTHVPTGKFSNGANSKTFNYNATPLEKTAYQAVGQSEQPRTDPPAAATTARQGNTTRGGAATTTKKPAGQSTAGGTTATADAGGVTEPDATAEAEAYAAATGGSEGEDAAPTITTRENRATAGSSAVGMPVMTIVLIVGAVLVLGGGGVALIVVLVLKKR